MVGFNGNRVEGFLEDRYSAAAEKGDCTAASFTDNSNYIQANSYCAEESDE